MRDILVTGGLGFIGSNFIRNLPNDFYNRIINLDAVTYAAQNFNNAHFSSNPRYSFVKGDINDSELVKIILDKFQPDIIVNFAAQTHVDRSISDASLFINSNINGTYNLLKEANQFYQNMNSSKKKNFRFIHISTDEVYGSLKSEDSPFSEESPYMPNNPYSASKAASNHLARAWNVTYGLPVITSLCSNNYGFYQNKEKLIPKIILNAVANKQIPIYGDGQNIRDWIFAPDHCDALLQLIEKGKIGETYNIGSSNEIKNIDLAIIICNELKKLSPKYQFLNPSREYVDQIEFTKDRAGHDLRYAISSAKIRNKTGWQAKTNFSSGIRSTIIWFLDNYSNQAGNK